MLKQFLTLSGFFICGINAKSQTPEPMVVKVAYSFIHIIDKQQPDTLHNEELVLRIGKNSAVYGSYPFSAVIQPREEAPPPPSGGVTRVYTGRPMAVVNDWGITNWQLVQKPAEKQLTRYESVGLSGYEITEKFPVIKWTTNTLTKKIGEYTCQQATGTYGGRNYTAWFTSDLPFSVGPWKLNGLPGVILEAYDEKQEVFFLFKKIATAETGEITCNESFKPPVKVSNDALNKAKRAFDENPSGIVQAQSGVSGDVSMRFKDRRGKFHSGEAATKLLAEKIKSEKSVLKNPLELSK
jgi:GLPGLI family protein